MNSLNDKFKTLLQSKIYQNSENFNQYISKNSITQDEEQTLLKAFQKLKDYQISQQITPKDAFLIDKAIEIQKKYDNRSKQLADSPVISSTKETQKESFENLEFRGDSKEYFKIWIVNIFLTIVTIGIYSAWAKVRTNRYFYANTFYKGNSFEYTATPIAILKGRLIVFGIYAIFIASSQIFLNVYISIGILILALLITPWIINKAIKFKLRNIKHRNINFYYTKNSPPFYKFFLIHLVLNILTIGLAYPYSLNKFKSLLINNAQFGTAKFAYEGTTSNMYKQFLKAIGLYLSVTVLPIMIIGVIGSLVSSYLSNSESLIPLLYIFLPIIAILGYVFLIFAGFIAKGIYDALISNFVWNNTTLEKVTFKSTLKPFKLAWIYFSNIIVIILSLGLLAPWAKVRVTRYKCEHFAISAMDVSNFIATKQQNQSALGEEVEDFFDIDIGF